MPSEKQPMCRLVALIRAHELTHDAATEAAPARRNGGLGVTTFRPLVPHSGRPPKTPPLRKRQINLSSVAVIAA
jgi:hypothetical protein